jgi:hypothetical protein
VKSLPTDERRTPRWFFQLVDELFGPFDLDACAARWNAQCRRFVTKEQDIFAHHPRSRRTWRNPPYSRGNLYSHLEDAREVLINGVTEELYANLVPADPSTDWWLENVARPEGEPVRSDWLWQKYRWPFGNATRYVSQGLSTTVVMVDGRLAFDGPDGPICSPRVDLRQSKAPGAMQPSALVVFERPDAVSTRRAA